MLTEQQARTAVRKQLGFTGKWWQVWPIMVILSVVAMTIAHMTFLPDHVNGKPTTIDNVVTLVISVASFVLAVNYFSTKNKKDEEANEILQNTYLVKWVQLGYDYEKFPRSDEAEQYQPFAIAELKKALSRAVYAFEKQEQRELDLSNLKKNHQIELLEKVTDYRLARTVMEKELALQTERVAVAKADYFAKAVLFQSISISPPDYNPDIELKRARNPVAVDAS